MNHIIFWMVLCVLWMFGVISKVWLGLPKSFIVLDSLMLLFCVIAMFRSIIIHKKFLDWEDNHFKEFQKNTQRGKKG